jgi:DNA polymerase-3 subunit epsilon
MKDFVALDFETAKPERSSVCAVGIVKVVDGFITEKFYSLIKPFNNEYSIHNTNVHLIDSEMTKNCKSFPDVFPILKNYINNQLIVCHNTDFDIDVLLKSIEFYGIKDEIEFEYECTCKLNNGKKLDTCCEENDIILNHHDPLSDAECCALLYLKMNGITKIQKREKPIDYRKYENEKHLSSEIKKSPNLDEIENKDSVFFGNKIVITGNFDNIILNREQIALKIKNLGGDINSTISKKTNIVIIGSEAGPKKLLLIKELKEIGIDIKIIYEPELKTLLNI